MDRSLRGSSFRFMWAARTVSSLGSAVSSVAFPLVAVLILRASTFEVGVVSAAGTVAWLLVGLPAGLWVEDRRRRPILINCDLVRAVLLISVPLAAAASVLSITQLAVVALGMGVANVIYGVAVQAYLPFVVDRRYLVAANGRTESAQLAASSGGQALGGVLVTAIGASAALLLDIGSYLMSAALMARIPREPDPESSGSLSERSLQRIAEGLRYLWSDPVIRALTLTAAVLNLGSAALETVLIPYLVRDAQLSAVVVGVVLAADRVGGFFGASLSGWVVGKLGPANAMLSAICLTTPFALLIPLARGPLTLIGVCVGLGVLSAGISVSSVVSRSSRQARVPPELLARVSASIRFISWGVLPIGALAGGALGSIAGNRTALWAAAAALLVAGAPLVAALVGGGRKFIEQLTDMDNPTARPKNTG